MCSVVAAHTLNCTSARGILVLQSGVEPMSPGLEGKFLATGQPGKTLFPLFYIQLILYLWWWWEKSMQFGKQVYYRSGSLLYASIYIKWASLVAQMVKNLPAMQETQVWSLDWEDLLEKGMTTHSSILAQRTPWTEEPGGLQFMGSQRVRLDWANNTHTQAQRMGMRPGEHRGEGQSGDKNRKERTDSFLTLLFPYQISKRYRTS